VALRPLQLLWLDLTMQPRLSGSTLLADASGFAKTIYGLTHDGFYPADFVDFATIIEHGILGDIVLVRGGTAVPPAMLEPVRELIREGAVRILENRPPIMPLPRHRPAHSSGPDSIFNPKRSRANDARLEAERIAGAELLLGRPGMLSMRQRNTYEQLARPADEHWVCDLMSNHQRLADALHRFRKQANRPGYVMVRVPPFAHLVLSKAQTFDQALEIMLDYRQRCAPIRDAVDDLYALMSSPDVGAMRKAEERDKFMGSWDTMIAACGQTSTAKMMLANSQAQLLRHSGQAAAALFQRDIEDTVHHGRKALDKFMELIGEEEWERNHPWTLRPVRVAAWEYLLAPDRAMYDAAHRIFGISPPIVEARMRDLIEALARRRAA
jgi:hypothetical protein